MTIVVGVVRLAITSRVLDIERPNTSSGVHQRLVDDSPKVVSGVGVGDGVGEGGFDA